MPQLVTVLVKRRPVNAMNVQTHYDPSPVVQEALAAEESSFQMIRSASVLAMMFAVCHSQEVVHACVVSQYLTHPMPHHPWQTVAPSLVYTRCQRIAKQPSPTGSGSIVKFSPVAGHEKPFSPCHAVSVVRFEKISFLLALSSLKATHNGAPSVADVHL